MHLGRKTSLFTTTSAAQAVEIRERDLAVVVTDLRMPPMWGAHLLAKARVATRVLLTGQADLSSAIATVNDAACSASS